jgi:hypothetical protein
MSAGHRQQSSLTSNGNRPSSTVAVTRKDNRIAGSISLMQIERMSHATRARAGVTVRLAPDAHDRLRRIAEAEHRSVAGYLELLVERDLAARDDAERVVRVHIAPELAGVPQGTIHREAGESQARYARRSAVLRKLFDDS